AVAAGTWIRGGDEHEAARERDRPGRPRDRHLAVLERGPQRLERVAAELAQLIEEEDAAMGPRHLPRPWRCPAADQGPPGHRVVRRPKRTPQPRHPVLAADAGDPGDLDHLVEAEGR